MAISILHIWDCEYFISQSLIKCVHGCNEPQFVGDQKCNHHNYFKLFVAGHFSRDSILYQTLSDWKHNLIDFPNVRMLSAFKMRSDNLIWLETSSEIMKTGCNLDLVV